MEKTVIYCESCGAPLDVEMNRAFIFCQFCGTKNVIRSQQMEASINMSGVNISARTDIESLINAAEYAVAIGNYDKADEILGSVIMTGCNDFRVYIVKGKIDIQRGDDKSLFRTIAILRRMETKQSPAREVTNGVRYLMGYRGMNGIIALHSAAYHEQMDLVAYCVEHGADVNCMAGMNMVTPISIMFVPVDRDQSGIDGTPFVRHPERVKQIRDYLMAHGARDQKRRGY